MKCLRCESVEMDTQPRGVGEETIEIDVCPECSGLWLDQQELKEMDDNFFVDMEEIEYEETAPTDEDKSLTCPRCESAPTLAKCHPTGFEKVVVDTCPECKGFWLDEGEMGKIRDVSDQLLIASLLPLDES
ncbi:MAG: hypothetical protein GY854_31035 [Deltaproteobacteria bacterium]|nr:hypothetical protein [Deltaproteobacteria bacterium]